MKTGVFGIVYVRHIKPYKMTRGASQLLPTVKN